MFGPSFVIQYFVSSMDLSMRTSFRSKTSVRVCVCVSSLVLVL